MTKPIGRVMRPITFLQDKGWGIGCILPAWI
jgi:hypothetical protein